MKKSARSRSARKRSRYSLQLGRLEDRTLLSAAVTSFCANPQHTSVYEPTAQNLDTIKWQTPVDLNPQYSSGELLIHYGAALATANNTILVPAKTGATNGFEINAFNGSTVAGTNPTPMYTLTTDYILPSHGWTPSYGPALSVTSSGTRLYFAGAGGTVYCISNPDSATPGSPTQLAFFGLANYQANASAFNSTVFIDTPITADSNGNIFFGFRVQGTAPAPLSTTQSGYARIDANGNGSYVLAGNAASDATHVSWDNHNTAPALSNDGSTIYVVVKSATSWSTYGYLLGLNSTTLATKYKVFLTDPASGGGAGILDDSTASPMVGPDGDVFLGIMGNPYNGSRGYLLHFDSTLTQEYAPGAFGWDNTAAIVPASMVPSYTGTSSYLIFSKYNDYAGTGAGSLDGNGINQAALLDPHAVEIDPHHDGNATLQVMREVFTANGVTPDPENITASTPDAVREWCINTAAVDPALDAVFFPSEDGNFYRWCLKDDQLMQAINIGSGIGQAYVPTVIGPDGTLYAVNDATLFAIGNQTASEAITITSSNEDLRGAVVGDSITFTAKVKNLSVSGLIPTGTVTFTDTVTSATGTTTTTTLGTVPLDSTGTASLTTSSLPAQLPGGHFITAVFTSGDGNFVSGQAKLVQFVHKSGTTTALTATPNPVNFGQSVTLTAIVTPTTSGLATPSGLVTFMDGTTFLGQVPLNSSAQATFALSSLAQGSHTITAIYQSDPVYAMSVGDNSGSPLVVQEATITAVSSSPNPSVAGQSVTLTTTVSSQDAGAGTPSGTMTFKLGSIVLASGMAVDASGQASFTTSALPVGSDTITAVFTGNTGWLTSSGDDSAAPQVVNQDVTATAVSASPTTSVYGKAVTFTATVTASSPGSGTPTGTVTFSDGSITLGTATLDNTGQAVFTTTSPLPVGSDTITATYNGDTNFVTSAGTATETVVSGTTTTTASASPIASVYSQLVTLTATVQITSGVGTPTGSVVFTVGSTTLGTATLDSSGHASITMAALPVGADTITATYGGDANFTGGSGNTSETVSQDKTTTRLTSSKNPAVVGQAVTFTAKVTAATPGTGIPTGTITFKEGTTVLATVTLDSIGHATYTTSSLSIGQHKISASYSGSSGFKVSNSATLTEKVRSTTTTALTSSLNPSQVGQAVTFAATVTPGTAGVGIPTGTVTFKDGSITLATVALDSNGQATYTTSSLTVGKHKITASYGGDITFQNSRSPILTQTVTNTAAATPMGSLGSPASDMQALDATWAVAVGNPFFIQDLRFGKSAT